MTEAQKAALKNAAIYMAVGFVAYKFGKWQVVKAAGAGVMGVYALSAATSAMAKGA
jgi:hypothetical protein